MRKEKYIIQRKNKKSTTFRVVIPYRGKTINFGSFNSKDYPTPGIALEAAKSKRDEVLRDMKQNTYIEHELTVDEAYQKTKELLIPNVNTQKRHDALYYPLIPAEMRHRSVKDITAAEIQQTLNNYAANHTVGQTKSAMTIWRQIYKVCLLMEMPIADRSRMVVATKSKIPVRNRKKHCTPDELEIFIEALANYGRDRKLTEDIIYALRIMQYLGLRPQEVFALCREDIDFENRLIHVQHSIGSDSDSRRKLIVTKTPWSVRTLPIPDGLFPILEELLARRDSMPLLVDRDGLPYLIDDIDMLLWSVSKKTGIKITLYMLRHNFATMMVQKDLKATQNMMGHDSAVMTMRYVKETSLNDMKKLLDPE